MGNDLQRYTNEWCLANLYCAQDEFNSGDFIYLGRLRSCQAKVYETESFYILESYSTNFVAIIDKQTKQCYDLLRHVYGYTSTSAQHISKFWHDYGDTKIQRCTYRKV